MSDPPPSPPTTIVGTATATAIHGDCMEVIPQLVAEGITVDSIVTDPPYHLLQVSRGGSRRQNDPAKPFGRAEARGGFMGQRWDGGDIAFRPETWATIGAALKPGGFLLAFGGTRTHHRMACAIEDAGFIIQDCVMWIYGSGFPKRRDSLKPAYEPIILAYKLGGKRTMQVDECRIDGLWSTWRRKDGSVAEGSKAFDGLYSGQRNPEHPAGRWPANICHDGSDEVMQAFAAFETANHGHHPARRNGKGMWSGEGGGMNGNSGPEKLMPDKGSPARFYYAAKASKADRAGSMHPTVKPIALMRWLVRLVTPPGGTVLDPFAGSGTTGVAALAEGRKAILVERELEYVGDIRRRLASYDAADYRQTDPDGEGHPSLARRVRNVRAAAPLPLFAFAQ